VGGKGIGHIGHIGQMKHLSWIFSLFLLAACSNSTKSHAETEPGPDVGGDTTIQPEGVTGERKKDTLELSKTVRFEDFKTELYTGELYAPDFRNDPFADDTAYVKFIKKGCERNGINFAGQYTLIEKGCGTFCTHLFMVDRKNGKIFTNINIHQHDGQNGYEYRKDSRLLITNTNLFVDKTFKRYREGWCGPDAGEGHCQPGFYSWGGEGFITL
jgi:hypothetical protein